jgi:hypothetical protein
MLSNIRLDKVSSVSKELTLTLAKGLRTVRALGFDCC